MTDAWGEHFKLVYVDGSLSEVKVETKGDVSWRKRGTDSVAQPSHLLEEAQEAIEEYVWLPHWWAVLWEEAAYCFLPYP